MLKLSDYMTKCAFVDALFAKLPKAEREKIAVREYSAGRQIVRSTEHIRHLIIVLEGVLNAAPELGTGVQVVSYRLAPGDVVGVYGFCSDGQARGEHLCMTHVTAHTDTACAFVPFDHLYEWRINHFDFIAEATRRQMEPVHLSNELLLECGFYKPYHALVAYLIREYRLFLRLYSDGYNGPVRILESRQGIADFLGIDVRSVNRSITKLKTEQIISILKGKVHIDAAQYERLLLEREGSVLDD